MAHSPHVSAVRRLPFIGLALTLAAAAPAARAGVAADPPCSRVDDSPIGLTATASGATVTLRWVAPFGCTPASYSILAGSGPNLSNLADFSTGRSSTTLTVNGVAAGIYYVRVVTQAGAVRSSPSNEAAIAVGVACELPAAPQAFSATATASSASMEWDAPAGSPTAYLIEAGSAPGLANLVTLTTAGPATTFSTAAPVGTYYVRVRARNGCGAGPASNEAIVAVAPPTPMPPVVEVNAPVTLTGTQVVVVSAATVTVRGRIELHDRSMLIIRDSVFNHLSDYAGQFDLWAFDDSTVIVERSTVDTSLYLSWHFFDRSTLQMTHATNRSPLWHGFQQRARATFAHVTRAYGTGAEGTMLQIHHAEEAAIEVVFRRRAGHPLSQARAHNRARYTLERSYVTGDVVASDDSVITMTGGGVGGRAVREPRAQMFLNGTLTHSPAFDFGCISRITSGAGEVLSGAASIKASYTGTDRYTNIVRTRRGVLPLVRGRTYRASFRYRILTPPSQGFDMTFASPTAFSRSIYLPNLILNGAAGAAGTATLTVTLAPYDDYELSLSVVGTGAILVDDVQIVDVETGASVTETAETLLAVP